MKDTEVKRLLYQNSEAFLAGVEVGIDETINKAAHWLFANVYDYSYPEDQNRVADFIQAMKE